MDDNQELPGATPGPTATEPASPARPRPDRWGLLATFFFVALIVGLYLIGQIVLIFGLMFYRGFVAGRTRSPVPSAAEMMSSLASDGTLLTLTSWLSVAPVLFCLAVMVYLRRGLPFLAYFRLVDPGGVRLLWWSLVSLVFSALAGYVPPLLDDTSGDEFMAPAWCSRPNTALFVVALVVLGPLLEELVFRGALFDAVAGTVAGPVAAALVTSALWAAIHGQYGMPTITVLFLDGLLLSAARQHTGSVVVCLVMHAVWNAVSVGQVALGWNCP